MPDTIYELIARGARYWFLLLMLIIVLRSFRWYLQDTKSYKRFIKRLPDAGSIGRMEILHGGELKQIGLSFPVPHEGTIGSGRLNDIRIKGEGIQKTHLRFHFEDRVGLMVEKDSNTAQASIDGVPLDTQAACMVHESHLYICGVEAQLLLFEGFECYGLPEKEDISSSMIIPNDSNKLPSTAQTFAPERVQRRKPS